MSPADVVHASMRAWENNDAEALASCLTGDFFCAGQMPDKLNNIQFVDYMKNLMRAFPDWKFNEHIVNTQGDRVTVNVSITGTNTGELVVPGLPPILPTDKPIALPPRDWEYTIRGDQVSFLSTDMFNRPGGGFAGILAQLGMALPTYDSSVREE